jgi:uncharacterized membrane protein
MVSTSQIVRPEWDRVVATGAWGMDFVSSSPLFSTTPPLFSKFSYKSFLFQNFHNHSFFLHLTISIPECEIKVISYQNTGPCKVRNETETKHNETKRNTTKRNRICKLRNETETKHNETKRNTTKRNKICKLRNETKQNKVSGSVYFYLGMYTTFAK